MHKVSIRLLLKETFPLMSSFDCRQLPTPENDVLFHGIFMDGFRWDEKEMVVTDSIKGIMNSPLCMFNMEHKMDFLSDEADYIVPL